MSILMSLSPYVSLNSIRLSPKKILINAVPAWNRLKTDVTVSRVENEVYKMVVRKKFKELPTVMKLSDGSNAPVLGEWLGGLNSPKEPLGGQSPSSSDGKGVPSFGLQKFPSCPLNFFQNVRKKTHAMIIIKVCAFLKFIISWIFR